MFCIVLCCIILLKILTPGLTVTNLLLRSHNRRVMATARAVRLASSRAGSTTSLQSLANTEDESSNRSSMYLSDGESYISDGGAGGDNG